MESTFLTSYLVIIELFSLVLTAEASVVTTTELSLPPRWLATTEPAPPSRCFTVCSPVFLGLFPENYSSLWQHHLIPAWTWTHNEISLWQYHPPSPTCPILHSQTGQHRAAATVSVYLVSVLSETVVTVSLSTPSTVACSEQLAHSRTTNHDIHLLPINIPSLDTDRYLPPAPPPRWHVKKHRHRPSCKFLPP